MGVRGLVGMWFLVAAGNLLGAWLLDVGTAFFLWSLAASLLWGPTRRLLHLGNRSRVIAALFVVGVLLLFVLRIRNVITNVPPLPHGPPPPMWWLAIPPFVAALAIASAARTTALRREDPDALNSSDDR